MIKKEEVKHIAKLVRVNLKEKEIKEFQKELSSVLDYFGLLQKIDTKKTKATFHSMQNYFKENIIRDDKVASDSLADNLLKLAPVTKGRYIKVKSVF